MTRGERSALRGAVVVVLAAAGGRWAVDRVKPGVDPLGARPDRVAVLDSASRVVEADEARRSRPLEPGERIDANRAPEAELDRLPGVGPSLARAWVAHRETHGGYRGPADLEAVPGIGPATAARLGLLLQFSTPGSMLRRREAGAGPGTGTTDLNLADSLILLELPGIGPALAGRILERRRRTRFRSVDDLLEIRGIGPATLDRLRPLVTAGRR